MKRRFFVCIVTWLLAGCQTVTVQTAPSAGVQNIEVSGKSYIADYYAFDGAAMEVFRTDGTVGLEYSSAGTVVSISRGDESQFNDTKHDELEARAAATEYCDTLKLSSNELAKVSTRFIPASNDDNAEWRIYNLCERPVS